MCGQNLWPNICGQLFVAKYMWPNICGQTFVTKYLLPTICGQTFVAKYLWQNYCGKTAMAKYLWLNIVASETVSVFQNTKAWSGWVMKQAVCCKLRHEINRAILSVSRTINFWNNILLVQYTSQIAPESNRQISLEVVLLIHVDNLQTMDDAIVCFKIVSIV